MSEFQVKDSGARQSFDSGMVRDTTEGKTEYRRVFDGPMLQRWAEHLTKGAAKYPDVEPGVANWTLAAGEAEYQRFRDSAVRHMMQWLRGDRDEDHAAAVLFNINGAEYVRERLAKIDTTSFGQSSGRYIMGGEPEIVREDSAITKAILDNYC